MSSLYLHIPFCSRKCPYCDFFSEVGTQQKINNYVELLNRNIKILRQHNLDSPPFETIFFGGGTPSLLSIQQIKSILHNIQQNFGIESTAEITLEANPGTIDLDKLQGYRQAGINRLSLGIQSLDDQNLQLLGRIHSAKQAQESIVAARAAGFDNLSLDLIFALPNQCLSALEHDVSALLDFNPEHISLYGLSFEEGTEFFSRLKSGKITVCEESLYADQYLLLHEKLVAAGYDHYEISNFSRPGKRCQHNQVYWQRGNCLAVGVGSHGFDEQEWGTRWHTPTDMKRYEELLLQGRDPAELLETYEHYGAMKEYVYLGLRTRDGINLRKFEQKFGGQYDQVFAAAIHKTRQYIQTDEDHSRFNIKGWLIYDHLISSYL